MGRYRTPTPIGYKGPFKNMEHIYEVYRKTLMNTGQYRPYFNSRTSYGESPRKFIKNHYSPERHQPERSEGEGKEQRTETNAAKNIETKNEINKTELSQKTEDSQKIEPAKENETSQKIEKQNELSYEKLGPPESQEKSWQTDIMSKKRPSLYGDRIESRW